MKWLRKQWLLLLIKLYSNSLPPIKHNMEDLIKNAYTTNLEGTPICSIGSKQRDKITNYYESVNFFVQINGKGMVNIAINILNKDLVFTINEIHLKDMNSAYLFELIGRMKNIEDNLKPKLKPYFGL